MARRDEWWNARNEERRLKMVVVGRAERRRIQGQHFTGLALLQGFWAERDEDEQPERGWGS